MPDISLEPTLQNLALAFLAAQLPEITKGVSEETPLRLQTLLFRFGGEDGLLRHLVEILRAPQEADRRLVQMRDAFGLTDAEVLTIALCAGVDDDLWTGRLVAYVAQRRQGLASSRPALGLLAQAFAVSAQGTRISAGTMAEGTAFGVGMLVFTSEAEPLAERLVSVPLPVARALAGHEVEWPGQIAGAAEKFEMTPTQHEQAVHHAGLLRGVNPPVLVVRASARDEALMAVDELVGTLEENREARPLRPLFLDPAAPLPGLEVWLRLRRCVPVFVYDPAPGEVKQVPRIPHRAGPVIATAGMDGGVSASWRDHVDWRLPMPTRKEREVLWGAVFGKSSDAKDLSQTHRQGAARIAQVGRLARLRAAMAKRKTLFLDDVRDVSRSGEGTGLGALAQLMPGDVPGAAFIRTKDLRDALAALLSRCRLRDGLADGLGPSAKTRYTPGVRALFTGPSGTGKTLAAGWLATKLGLPLYRVDLAAISSKYIGETERNLSQLLAAAEHTAAVLLFDEADSLFGKRTDVRDANDRFANAQTNYLLQRIETFDGIAVLTSNSRAHLDAAFTRRLDVVIEFPLPGAIERRELWAAHLAEKSLTDVELNLLAGQADLAGGQIRNVVFAAAVEAGANGGAIAFPKILGALVAEYRKAGRTPPQEIQDALQAAQKPKPKT